MSSRDLRLAVLFLAIARPACSVELEPGTVRIGEACRRDYHCIENAFCRVQLTCRCEQNYAPSPDRSTCIATSGLRCTSDATCRTMSNARCLQGACACHDDFTLDLYNSSNCIRRPTSVGDRCQRYDECAEALGRAVCIDERCRCYTGHHFVNETGSCVLSKSIYTACTNDYQCFLDEKSPNALRCHDGECVCAGAGCGKATVFVLSPTVASLVSFGALLLAVVRATVR